MELYVYSITDELYKELYLSINSNFQIHEGNYFKKVPAYLYLFFLNFHVYKKLHEPFISLFYLIMEGIKIEGAAGVAQSV
jgi:hypothetical protein